MFQRLATFAAVALSWSAEPNGWVVCYSGGVPVADLKPFRLVVLDSDDHPPLKPLATGGRTLLGYLSAGEVESNRAHFQAVKSQGLLLKENENWKGSFYVDLREPCWTTRVTGELVPAILAQGFHGVFLDTLDNPIELEHSDPAKYRGMKQAAAGMVREIRRRFPRITIMMNRAYELLPGVEQSIDIVLGESVFATYDFSKKTYHLVDREEYLQQVKVLKQAKARRPALRVLTLDYWNPADTKGLTRIYREERANGFEPYVSTIELDRVIREPR